METESRIGIIQQLIRAHQSRTQGSKIEYQLVKGKFHEQNQTHIKLKNAMRESQKFLNEWELQDDSMYVGRAFESDKRMIFIWDVPQPETTLLGETYLNAYQLPCINLWKNEYNFFDAIEEECVFVKDLDPKNEIFKEISFERFFDSISERMADFTCYLEQVRSAAVEATEV